ncbi:unnamed protein product [Effrenium voratum]|nr:unnamed protein product [Effrenium voratum]
MGSSCCKTEATEVEVVSRRDPRLSCRRDTPDHRDLHLEFPAKSDTVVDLRPYESFPVFTQGFLASCTANALSAAYHFSMRKQLGDGCDFTPSRLFIWYNERAQEGLTDQNAGTMLRDGIKVLHKLGVCSEDMWPYILHYSGGVPQWRQKPSQECYDQAAKCKVEGYARVAQDVESLKNCLRNGFPFIFLMVVLDSFMGAELAKTGAMAMPPGDRIRGSHALVAVGFEAKRTFLIRNSWGEEWGDRGYFHMPYGYICCPLLTCDFWVINWVQPFSEAKQKSLT